jgi:hypothetical protein
MKQKIYMSLTSQMIIQLQTELSWHVLYICLGGSLENLAIMKVVSQHVFSHVPMGSI